jgi:hypothetical protein
LDLDLIASTDQGWQRLATAPDDYGHISAFAALDDLLIALGGRQAGESAAPGVWVTR